MTPVAAPVNVDQDQVPVAPPDVRNPAPVGGAVAPAQPVEADLNSLYEDAASKGDPVSMYSLTSKVKGTSAEPIIKRSAEIMQRNLKEFENDIKPAIDAGGPNTPQGRIATSKTFETIADKPQKMRAFVELLLGNPNWRNFVTGGTPRTVISYDNQGNMLEKTTNELGQIISVVDSSNGKALTRDELKARGGLVPSLAEATGYQQKKEISKFNTEALNKANAATAEYAAKAPELGNMYGELRQRLQNLYGADLSEEQRKAIGSFTNRSLGYAQTVSEGMNALKQKVDNKNVSLSESQQKSLSSVLEKLGFKIAADGSIQKGTGEAVTKTDLDQAQNTLTSGTQFQRGFNQSKEDFIRSEVFKGLGEAEMKNLGRVLDLQMAIEKSQLELTSKHGTLPFLINPKSYQLGDEFARGEASALIGEFNQQATEMFAKWRENQLRVFKEKNDIPSAGELESAFAKTGQFRELRERFAELNKDILRRPGGSRVSTGQTPAEYGIDLGIGQAAKEEPKSIKSRSLKAPKVESRPVSARDLATQFGGRKE